MGSEEEGQCSIHDPFDMRNRSDHDKINFIDITISQKDIPKNFVPLPKSNSEKIFFRENGEKREFILFENNKFFCVFCVCYSLYTKHRLITGINYEKGCTVSQILKQHENEKHHINAKRIYEEKNSACVPQADEQRQDKRVVLNCIVKIIIFQASHGNNIFLS